MEAGRVQIHVAQKAARHRAESDKRCTEFGAGLEYGNLRVTRPQRVLGLQCRDRMFCMRFAQGGCRHFGQADGLDLARAHQVAQGTHAVFYRHRFVPAVQVIQVDHFGLQAAQRGLASGLDGRGPPVDHAHQLAVARHVHALHAAFAGERETFAFSLEHLANQGFVGAKAVQRGGVEQRDTGVECGQQNLFALLGGWRQAVGVAQVHTAKADGGDCEGAELAGLHLGSSLHGKGGQNTEPLRGRWSDPFTLTQAASCCSSRCRIS